MSKSPKKDWSGHKYTLIKNVGHDIDIIALVKNLNTNDENWHLFSHDLGGGATVTHKFFQKYILNPKYTPNKNASDRVCILKKGFLIYQHLKTQGKKISYPWYKTLNADQKNTNMAYTFIPMAAIDAIQKHCREISVGVSSFYLFCLDQVAKRNLLSKPSDRTWVLTHDVRASLNIDSKNTPGNYAAGLYLRLPEQDNDTQYINAMRKELYKRSIIWGSWAYSSISRFFSDNFITKAYLKMPKPSWFGVMSNIGSWESKETDGSEDHLGIIISPFASPLFAVTSSLFKWEKHMGTCLILNPELVTQDINSHTLAQQWTKEIYVQANIGIDLPSTSSKPLNEIFEEAKRLDE